MTSHFTQLRGREHGEQQLATAADDQVHAGGEGLLQDADEVRRVRGMPHIRLRDERHQDQGGRQVGWKSVVKCVLI